MAAAYIEHRPKSTDQNATTSHYVIVTDGAEKHGSFQTQKEAKEKACAEGYHPVHVARVRHAVHGDPDQFRIDPC